MKTLVSLLMTFVAIPAVHAEFRTWTRADGKTAELDLVAVSGSGNDKTGEFKTRAGSVVKLSASGLSAADAKALADWKPAAAATTAAPAEVGVSAYDKYLGDLVKLNGKSLKSYKEPVKPSKYYLFYYSASWCGPCHKFTPSLVDFYNKNKPGNDQFEVILVTADSNEDDMDKYAVEFKMPWPHLKLSKVEKFEKEFKHPGGGIPNLVLTDTQGKLLKTSYEGTNYVGPNVVMDHLGTLLKK